MVRILVYAESFLSVKLELAVPVLLVSYHNDPLTAPLNVVPPAAVDGVRINCGVLAVPAANLEIPAVTSRA